MVCRLNYFYLCCLSLGRCPLVICFRLSPFAQKKLTGLFSRAHCQVHASLGCIYGQPKFSHLQHSLIQSNLAHYVGSMRGVPWASHALWASSSPSFYLIVAGSMGLWKTLSSSYSKISSSSYLFMCQAHYPMSFVSFPSSQMDKKQMFYFLLLQPFGIDSCIFYFLFSFLFTWSMPLIDYTFTQPLFKLIYQKKKITSFVVDYLQF